MDKPLKTLLFVIFLILIGVAGRITPHPANFTPITAITLFVGAYLSKKYTFIVPVIIMVLSDFILGFNKSTPIVYTCFLITGLIALKLKNNTKPTSVFYAAILSSLIFYLVTNFNYWYAASMYSKDLSGMVSSYIAALPFFKNELLGNLTYTSIFFGGYEILLAKVKKKKLVFSN